VILGMVYDCFNHMKIIIIVVPNILGIMNYP
jgi:hypothetical protein